MPDTNYILFCENPFEPNKVDADYEEEFIAAKQNDFDTLLYNFEDLTSDDRFENATRKIKPSDKLENVIYRGWMLPPNQYTVLYNALLKKNFKLINSAEQYKNCHYLPDSLRFISNRTPKTVFEQYENESSIGKLIEKTKVFGDKPVIIKDYVKSEKHDWETACFVSNASEIVKLKQIINNFIALRGKYLNEGIVVREFIQLNDLAIHSKSGMPLTEEYRLFFCNKRLVGIYDYWEEGQYKLEKPGTKEFEDIAKEIDSNFFSMDIARQKNGELIIIELGDGQVAGLPDKVNRNEFYNQVKNYY
jgi:hypothetical protein